MYILRVMPLFLLSLSIVLAGFPAQAKPECPMMKMMQAQHMDMQAMEDCDGCDKMAKQEQKKSGCCDDAACASKCSVMSNGASMILPTIKADRPAFSDQARWFFATNATPISAHLNSQERPPKSLS